MYSKFQCGSKYKYYHVEAYCKFSARRNFFLCKNTCSTKCHHVEWMLTILNSETWMRSSQVWLRAKRGWYLANCECDLAKCGWDLAKRGWDLSNCGWDLAKCGWDIAKWLERLDVNAKVAPILGSIPAPSDTVESEGRKMKKCWITYFTRKTKEIPFIN